MEKSNEKENPVLQSDQFFKSNTNDQSSQKENSITSRSKLVLLGDSQTGKSAFIVRLFAGVYNYLLLVL